MHVDLALVVGSVVVGFLVGLTGMGGGALMTPMLVLVFGVAPSAAISSDLIAALFMKPLGVAVHWRRRTIEPRLVRYLCYGSVPSALAGTYAMHLLGATRSSERHLEVILGAALIVGAAAMAGRAFFAPRALQDAPLVIRRPLIVAVGALGGFMVGLTSVGAGSLIIVMLLLVYPHMRSDQLVGTDLAQSIPLTAAATLGTLLFGHVEFTLTASIIIGSVPAVVVGSLLSSHAFTSTLRPFLAGLALLSGLKYVGLPPASLAIAATAIAITATFIAVRARRPVDAVSPLDDVAVGSVAPAAPAAPAAPGANA